jgi:hypothetical protein
MGWFSRKKKTTSVSDPISQKVRSRVVNRRSLSDTKIKELWAAVASGDVSQIDPSIIEDALDMLMMYAVYSDLGKFDNRIVDIFDDMQNSGEWERLANEQEPSNCATVEDWPPSTYIPIEDCPTDTYYKLIGSYESPKNEIKDVQVGPASVNEIEALNEAFWASTEKSSVSPIDIYESTGTAWVEPSDVSPSDNGGDNDLDMG